MQKSNTQPLKNVIRQYLKALNIDNKLKEIEAVNNWESIIGKTIARATNKIYIKNNILFIYIGSSVIRNELAMIKSGILKAFNDKAGEKLINDIVLR